MKERAIYTQKRFLCMKGEVQTERRTLYMKKRALYTKKIVLHITKRALYIQKKFLFMKGGVQTERRTLYMKKGAVYVKRRVMWTDDSLLTFFCVKSLILTHMCHDSLMRDVT